ncbi:cupin domain-containing protein [Pseudonocardia sp. NPDC046786]|uniref:cupin domain-containing protein n=1 Tax=Pseudonocardia sp. NPDC046786 TaxID=3155471 RepID=UPI0033D10BFE
MKVRRVVMGSDTAGRTAVLDDGPVEPTTVALLPGVEIVRVWESDGAALPVTDASAGDHKATFFPPHPGLRFGLLSVPPGITYVPDESTDLAVAAAEIEQKLPGAAATFAFPEQPGAHVTQTVDYIVVVAGAGVLRFDDVEVRVSHGDTLIQNGTPHAWFNDGTEPFVVAFALCGATQS